jgi:hypothetical protein
MHNALILIAAGAALLPAQEREIQPRPAVVRAAGEATVP